MQQLDFQVFVFDSEITHRLIGQHIGYETAHRLFDTVVGIDFQIGQALPRPGSQRWRQLQRKLTLVGVSPRRNLHQLGAGLALVHLPRRSDRFRRSVAIHRQRMLFCIRQPAALRRERESGVLGIRYGHIPAHLDISMCGYFHLLSTGSHLGTLRAQVHLDLERIVRLIEHHGPYLGLVPHHEEARQNRLDV